MKIYPVVLAICIVACVNVHGIPVLHQIDTFQGGTTMGYSMRLPALHGAAIA